MPPNDASNPGQPSAGDPGGEPPAPGLFARSSAALRRAGGKLRHLGLSTAGRIRDFGTLTAGRIRDFATSTAGRIRRVITSARTRWAALPRRTRLVRGTLVVVVVVGTPLTLWERCGIMGCPDVGRLVSFQPDGAPVVMDRNGVVLARLLPVQRQVVSLADLPAHVPLAFIAVEDRRFRSHGGVDWVRVVGAAVANVRAGGVRQGSSTITMQVARNVFPDRIRAQDRTFRRKLVEARVAREIEDRFTKDQILELYLNHIYFGGGAYGVEAASRHYFGQPASELTLDQAATLAALPKAPSHYDPRRQPERSRVRRDVVLGLMAAQGVIDSVTAAGAREEATAVTRRAASPEPTGARAGYFVQMVRALLEDELGDALYAQPLRIHTTLDVEAQQAVEEEMERQFRRIEAGTFGRSSAPRMADHGAGSATTAYVQGAAVVMDPATGEIRALVGGRNHRHSAYNRATQGRRQAGSAFKPFVFAAALSRDWSPSDRIEDSPFRLAMSRDNTWEPENFDGRFVGDLTLREALVQSRNVPTVRLIQDVGEGEVARISRGAGIRGEVPRSPVSALGVTEVSPLELTAAYAVFANGGEAVTPTSVLRVEDPAGAVVWVPEAPRPEAVLHPGVAWLVTDMLRDVVDQGTGRSVRRAGFRGHAAGKTGTTNEGADAWFVGYTPGLLAGVWMGFDHPRPIAPGATGGSVTAEVWGRIMSRIDRGGQAWPMPSSVVEVAVDPASGRPLAEGCSPRGVPPHREIFLASRLPDTVCPAGSGRSWFGRFADWIRGDDAEDRGEGPARRQDEARRMARESGGDGRITLEGELDRDRDRVQGSSERERRQVRRQEEERRDSRRREEELREARREVERARREADQAAREFQRSVDETLRELRQGARDGGEVVRELLEDLAQELEEGSADLGPMRGRLEGGLRSWFEEEVVPALQELEQAQRERERGRPQ